MQRSNTPAGAKTARTVSRVAAILRHLAAQPSPQRLSQIARAVALSPRSCSSICRTLAAEGFLDFDPDTQCYDIGPEAVTLARHAIDPESLYEVAYPDVRRLAQSLHATVSLWRLASGWRMGLLGHVESGDGARIDLTPGQRLPQLIGAIGRYVAGQLSLSKPALEAHFRKLRWDDPPDFEIWLADIERARQTGWAVDRDHHVRGVTSIAAGIDDMEGQIRLALVASRLSAQISAEEVETIGNRLADAAALLGSRLFGNDAFYSRYGEPGGCL